MACTTAAPDQHFARALGIEKQLLRANPDADYGHPGYVSVLRELRAVPRGASEKDRARKMAQRIQDGRRFAAQEAYAQIDHLPTRLEGREKPLPPRVSSPASASSPGKRRARAPKAAGGTAQLSALTAEQKARLDITMYSTTWCGYCKKARRWLTSNDIPFVEKDVEKDAAGAAEFRKLTGGRGGVPVITVGDTVIRGFSAPSLEAAIEKAAKSN